ncbi:uncharacterized protein LOC119116016 [Syngnathus acus]|uniref:uncharacterized protein LOC119116016 n=1 Tax=Syngnathus acus TaxID=161584 RepID=UPI001885D34B|nr:uncharacterized protein LOC119116016 [Syngnathus acus]
MPESSTKNHNEGSADPPQLSSLRTRKRPSDNLSSTDVDNTFQQVSIVISVQDQKVAQSSLTKLDVISDENVDQSELNDPVKKEQETTVTHPISDSQLGMSPVRDDTMSGKDEDEDQMTEKCDQILSQTEQNQVFPLTSKDSGQLCSTALEDQQRTSNGLQCNLVRNQKVSLGAQSNESMGDSKDDKTDTVTEEPTKKRKRMGMCGLTEKERSHFLQMTKTVNGQNSRPKVERQTSTNKVDIESSLLPPSLLSTPVTITAELRKEEVLHTSQDSAVDRPVTELHIPDAPCNGCDIVCKSSSLDGERHVCEEGSVLAPDPTVDTESAPPAMGKEHHLEKPNPQEVDCESFSLTSSDVEVQCVSVGTDEKTHDLLGDAMDCEEDKADALSVNTQEGDCRVKLCEVIPSGGSETNNMLGHDDDHCPGAVNTKQPQTINSSDSLGSGCFDFVSDSQLNNIELIDGQAIMEKVVKPSSHEEDASPLICGLIKELSFLNRTIMAAHREIENMRRGSKNTRSLPR